MSKRDKKRKKKQQPADEYRGVGFLTSMRGGLKNIAGTAENSTSKTSLKKLGDILFWIAILAVGGYGLFRCTGRW